MVLFRRGVTHHPQGLSLCRTAVEEASPPQSCRAFTVTWDSRLFFVLTPGASHVRYGGTPCGVQQPQNILLRPIIQCRFDGKGFPHLHGSI